MATVQRKHQLALMRLRAYISDVHDNSNMGTQDMTVMMYLDMALFIGVCRVFHGSSKTPDIVVSGF